MSYHDEPDDPGPHPRDMTEARGWLQECVAEIHFLKRQLAEAKTARLQDLLEAEAAERVEVEWITTTVAYYSFEGDTKVTLAVVPRSEHIKVIVRTELADWGTLLCLAAALAEQKRREQADG